MLRIITSRTHRHYQEAVAKVGTVPGMENELAQTREQLRTAETRGHESQERVAKLERTREEDTRTIGILRGQLDLMRDAVADVLRGLVGQPTPQAAVYDAVRAVLEHADLFGMSDTRQGRAALASLQETVTPKTVHLLNRYGVPRSAHTSPEGAKEAANRQGADLAGWSEQHRNLTDPAEVRDMLLRDWSVITAIVDAAKPWTTLGTPLSGVFVLLAPNDVPHSVHSSEDAARWAAAGAGITITGHNLRFFAVETETAQTDV